MNNIIEWQQSLVKTVLDFQNFSKCIFFKDFSEARVMLNTFLSRETAAKKKRKKNLHPSHSINRKLTFFFFTRFIPNLLFSSSLQVSSQTYSFLLLYKFHPKLYFNSRSTCIKFPPREISKGEGNPLAENADFFHRKFSPVLSSNVCFEYSKRNKAASVPSSFTYFTFQGQKR